MGNRWSEINKKITTGYKYLEIKSDGSFGWVPSIGQSIDFLIGRTENDGKCGGILNYVQTSKTYKINLNLPEINGTDQKDEKTIDKSTIIEDVIECLMVKTDFLAELEKLCAEDSNLIGANSGQYWEADPIMYLGDALKDKGYLIAKQPTYPKIGGRNRYQTYGILISGKRGCKKFNYDSKGKTTGPFFWSKFNPAFANY